MTFLCHKETFRNVARLSVFYQLLVQMWMGWPLTMGGLRLLHVRGVGFLRVIASPGAHRNIQINAVTRLILKSLSSVEPYLQSTELYVLLFDQFPQFQNPALRQL